MNFAFLHRNFSICGKWRHLLRQGIGKALINEGLSMLKEIGSQGCALVGDPNYYQRFGYTDEELELFRSNPKNKDIVSKAPDLMNKTIVAEVVTSHGCNSQHQVGDRFYFDGAGNLLTKLNVFRG